MNLDGWLETLRPRQGSRSPGSGTTCPWKYIPQIWPSFAAVKDIPLEDWATSDALMVVSPSLNIPTVIDGKIKGGVSLARNSILQVIGVDIGNAAGDSVSTRVRVIQPPKVTADGRADLVVEEYCVGPSTSLGLLKVRIVDLDASSLSGVKKALADHTREKAMTISVSDLGTCPLGVKTPRKYKKVDPTRPGLVEAIKQHEGPDPLHWKVWDKRGRVYQVNAGFADVMRVIEAYDGDEPYLNRSLMRGYK